MLLELDALTIALSAGGQQQPDGEVQIDCILLYLTTENVFENFVGWAIVRSRGVVFIGAEALLGIFAYTCRQRTIIHL